MNQSQAIAKNTIVLTIARLTERATGLVLVFAISRTLHATGLGVYSVAMAYYGLIATMAEMGSANYLVREIAKEPSKTNRYFVHVSLMGAMLSAVVTAFAVAALPYLGYGPELIASVSVVLLATMPSTMKAAEEAVFVAHQRTEFITFTTFVWAVLNVLVSLFLLSRGYGMATLFVAFVALQWVAMLLHLFLINRYVHPLRWEFQLSTAIAIAREIKTFSASAVIGGLFARPEIIILSLVVQPVQVGYYSAALKMVEIWYIISDSFMVNVFPVLSRAYHARNGNAMAILEKSIKYLLAIALPLAAGLTAAADPIVNRFYGSDFAPAVLGLRVLAWSIPLTYVNTVLWRALAARGEQHVVLRVQTFTTVGRALGGYLLSSWFSFVGAAVAGVTTVIVHNQLLAGQVRRDGTNIDYWQLGWRFGLAALVMGGWTWWFSYSLQLWALVPLGAAIYCLMVWALGAFGPEDLALLSKVGMLRARAKSEPPETLDR